MDSERDSEVRGQSSDSVVAGGSKEVHMLSYLLDFMMVWDVSLLVCRLVGPPQTEIAQDVSDGLP